MEILITGQSAPVEQWAEQHTCNPEDEHYAYSVDLSRRKDLAIGVLESVKKIGWKNTEILTSIVPEKDISKNIINLFVFEIHAETMKHQFLTADEETSMIYGAPEAIYLETAKESKRCHELMDLSRSFLSYLIQLKVKRSKKSYAHIFSICMNIALEISYNANYLTQHVGDALSDTYNIDIWKCFKEKTN